jgi:hypothetical protein
MSNCVSFFCFAFVSQRAEVDFIFPLCFSRILWENSDLYVKIQTNLHTEIKNPPGLEAQNVSTRHEGLGFNSLPLQKLAHYLEKFQLLFSPWSCS